VILKIIFFGDIIGKIGRLAIKKVLPEIKQKYQPDLIIANAENLAHGVGITQKTIDEMIGAGIDFFTSGNHIWRKDEAKEILNQKKTVVIRPANYPPVTPGWGEKVLEIGLKKLLVVNLLGRVFMGEQLDCPFRKFDEIYKKYEKENIGAILVDVHAEATSEKVALGHYLDGRAQAVIGTHTHVPTADAFITEKGTAYVTDAGMAGAKDSVIGIDKAKAIEMFLTQMPLKHDIPEQGLAVVNSVYLEIDLKNKKAKKIERIDSLIEI